MIQDEIRNKQYALDQLSNSYQHDVSMKDQMIQQLEAAVRDLKSQLGEIQASN